MNPIGNFWHQRLSEACGPSPVVVFDHRRKSEAAGVESSFERGDSAGGESCARAPETTNEEAPSMAQSAKTNGRVESRIFSFQLPFAPPTSGSQFESSRLNCI